MASRYADILHALTTALVGRPEHSAADVARLADVSVADARLLWRALGYPPATGGENLFSDRDVEMLRLARRLTEKGETTLETLLQITRVTGQALAQMSAVQVTLVADDIRRAIENDSGNADLETVRMTESLVSTMEPFIGFVWRRHLLAAVAQAAANAERPDADTRDGTVGFVDLVGFTALSQEISERELAKAVGRFERLVYERVPEAGGRIIKMIGDEVMFSADDAADAARIALGLVEATEGEKGVGLPARAGLASGGLIPYENDLFGPTVNLASRLVNVANPGTVLVSDQVASRLTVHKGAFVLKAIRPLKLKGFGKTPTWVLRRADSARTNR
jgi:adenylate cyclase